MLNEALSPSGYGCSLLITPHLCCCRFESYMECQIISCNWLTTGQWFCLCSCHCMNKSGILHIHENCVPIVLSGRWTTQTLQKPYVVSGYKIFQTCDHWPILTIYKFLFSFLFCVHVLSLFINKMLIKNNISA